MSNFLKGWLHLCQFVTIKKLFVNISVTFEVSLNIFKLQNVFTYNLSQNELPKFLIFISVLYYPELHKLNVVSFRYRLKPIAGYEITPKIIAHIKYVV